MARLNLTELEQDLTLPGGARGPLPAGGRNGQERGGVGQIFPIWNVNEGRSLDSRSGSQQASMAKYQQQSRTLDIWAVTAL